MTLQSSGALSLSQVQAEFGGANPIGMSEYYAGGANVPSATSGVNGAVPASGTISMSKFYGTSDLAFSPAGGTSAGSPEAIGDFAVYPGTASKTITCNQTATWTWTRSGSTQGGASIATGGTGTSITFTLPSAELTSRQTTYTVSATAGGLTRYWTVTLNAESNQ